ncbi:MAG: hypothetical protein ABIB61_03605 [Candidatus Shapirobacteria bacterium]
MFKNIISPIQAWLLSQNRCVGCGRPLNKAVRSKNKQGMTKATCGCGRIFIFEKKSKHYRRALFEEV